MPPLREADDEGRTSLTLLCSKWPATMETKAGWLAPGGMLGLGLDVLAGVPPTLAEGAGDWGAVVVGVGCGCARVAAAVVVGVPTGVRLPVGSAVALTVCALVWLGTSVIVALAVAMAVLLALGRLVMELLGVWAGVPVVV